MASPKTLTAEETEKLLHELRNWHSTPKLKPKGIRNHTIALLMLDAGLRVGEAVWMKEPDLWFNHKPVTSITISADIAKNKTERTIPVSQRLSAALKEMNSAWWTRCSFDYPFFAFYAHDGHHPMTTRQVERIIRQAAMKSLGRPIHPHVLRHTFASRLMRKTNVRVVQELLGHKHLTSTQVYTHPNGEDLKQAIDSLDARDDVYKENGRSQNSPAGVSNRLDAPGTNRDVR